MQYADINKLIIRGSEEEYQALVDYCLEKSRTQNDVLRGCLKSLGE
jgi:hypothetical protein